MKKLKHILALIGLGFITTGQAQTVLVEKTIFNSNAPIYLHSINNDLREVYFSSPKSTSLHFYDIKEDKVVEDKTIKAARFKGYVKMNEVYSIIQYVDQLDVYNSINKSRFTLIHPSDRVDINSITYDIKTNEYYTLSNGKVLTFEFSNDDILKVDTSLVMAELPGEPIRISSFDGTPFLTVEHGLDLSDLYMVDSTKTRKLRYPINYNAQNVAIEFLNDDTLFVSRNLRPGESELVMIYASSISRHPDSLMLDKVNNRSQDQIDSIKAEAYINALEFTDTVTRDVGQGRFATLIQRTNDALVAMTTLNQALASNPRSFISQKDSIYFVLGPKRTAPNMAKKDSLYYANNGLKTSIIDLGRDSSIVPDDVVIRLKVLDKETGKPVGYNVDYYDYESNTLVKSARLNDGEICYFSYLPKYKLGLTITADGYLPHSIRFDNTKQLVRMKQVEKLVLLQTHRPGVESSFTLNNIYFDFAKWNLTPVAQRELDIIKSTLEDASEITIVGHTDWIGSDEFNLTLSQKRAREAKDYLVKKGLKGTTINTVGKGERFPVATNKTDAGRAQNRRCEFVIK